MYLGNVESVRRGDIRASTKEGDIWYHGKATANAGSVIAENGIGSIRYSDTVRANNDVTATTTDGNIWYDGAVNAGQTIKATITEIGSITYWNTIKAGRDVIADTNAGNILFNSGVMAGRDVIIHTGEGDVTFNGKVTAGRDLPDQVRYNWGKTWYYSDGAYEEVDDDYPTGFGMGLDAVYANKDLSDRFRSGDEKIAYYDRYGLIGFAGFFMARPFRNADAGEIETDEAEQ